MIKFEHTEVVGWEHAIRGMRNPLESWEKSDSGIGCSHREYWGNKHEYSNLLCEDCPATMDSKCICQTRDGKHFVIGDNDLSLMKKLRNGGPDHGKFMRMIVVYVDITAPLYWWKEFDTYKIGTVANSESTMHCIHKKEFTLEDFSCEHLLDAAFIGDNDAPIINCGDFHFSSPTGVLDITIKMLNKCRERYLETKDKKYWWQMIQLLPTSYNQKRTVMLNYEVLRAMYHARKGHKLDEWSVGFIEWCESLPYSELITCKERTMEYADNQGLEFTDNPTLALGC